MPRYLSTGEAARETGLSRVTLWRWVRDKKVNPIKIGGRPAWTEKDIQTLKKLKDSQ